MKVKYMLKIICFQFLFFFVLFLYNCEGNDKSPDTLNQDTEKEKSSYLTKFKDTYICPKTGLSINESKKANLDCEIGNEILKVVELMVNAGWTEEEIDKKIQYFAQGRPLMQTIKGVQPCDTKGKLKLEFFIMTHCPYGVRFVDQALPDIVNNLGKSLEWHPYFIFSKNKEDELVSMHGEKEVQEGSRQICIREKWGNDKWLEYFKCFSAHIFKDKTKDWQACAEDVGIDIDELNLCVEGESAIMAEEDYSLTERYSSAASPTSVYDCSQKAVGMLPFETLKPALCSRFKDKKLKFCP